MGKYENHLLCDSFQVLPSCTFDQRSSECQVSEKHWWSVTNRRSGNTRRITCHFATWFAINPTRSGVRWQLGLRCGKKSISRRSYWRAFKDKNYSGLIWRHTAFVAVNILRLQFKNKETTDAYSEKQKTEVYSKCGVDFLKCKLLVYTDTTDCKV
jgi:hypothetical protein